MNERNPKGLDIRFIDSHYKDLFRLPDGGFIKMQHSNGEESTKKCTFIDEYHTVRKKEYASEIKKRIGVQIDTKSLDKELSGYTAKLKEVDLNKSRLEREIDSLPFDTKYRERKLHDMTIRLDGLYDTIVELEDQIEDVHLRKQSVEGQAITLENILKIMQNFDCIYGKISDEEKRTVVASLIKEIQLFKNDESDCPLRSITLNFPVFVDSGDTSELLWDKGNTVETVVLLSKVSRCPVNIDSEMTGVERRDID